MRIYLIKYFDTIIDLSLGGFSHIFRNSETVTINIYILLLHYYNT